MFINNISRYVVIQCRIVYRGIVTGDCNVVDDTNDQSKAEDAYDWAVFLQAFHYVQLTRSAARIRTSTTRLYLLPHTSYFLLALMKPSLSDMQATGAGMGIYTWLHIR
jgi:hypothetical protein